MTLPLSSELQVLNRRIHQVDTVRLFLDYDGTLADFAPNPGVIKPDKQLIDLLDQLAQVDKILPAVISGRRLADMCALLPVEGLLLAGTYGAEMQLPDGSHFTTVDFASLRPSLELLAQKWAALVQDRPGFYLEDKGCALALHARFVSLHEADETLRAARAEIEHLQPGPQFHIHLGDRFLEIAPADASKARAVAEIMDRFTPAGAMAIYAGDDEMDEEAFAEVKRRGGMSLRVASQSVSTQADLRLENYRQVRAWLARLID